MAQQPIARSSFPPTTPDDASSETHHYRGETSWVSTLSRSTPFPRHSEKIGRDSCVPITSPGEVDIRHVLYNSLAQSPCLSVTGGSLCSVSRSRDAKLLLGATITSSTPTHVAMDSTTAVEKSLSLPQSRQHDAKSELIVLSPHIHATPPPCGLISRNIVIQQKPVIVAADVTNTRQQPAVVVHSQDATSRGGKLRVTRAVEVTTYDPLVPAREASVAQDVVSHQKVTSGFQGKPVFGKTPMDQSKDLAGGKTAKSSDSCGSPPRLEKRPKLTERIQKKLQEKATSLHTVSKQRKKNRKKAAGLPTNLESCGQPSVKSMKQKTKPRHRQRSGSVTTLRKATCLALKETKENLDLLETHSDRSVGTPVFGNAYDHRDATASRTSLSSWPLEDDSAFIQHVDTPRWPSDLCSSQELQRVSSTGSLGLHELECEIRGIEEDALRMLSRLVLNQSSSSLEDWDGLREATSPRQTANSKVFIQKRSSFKIMKSSLPSSRVNSNTRQNPVTPSDKIPTRSPSFSHECEMSMDGSALYFRTKHRDPESHSLSKKEMQTASCKKTRNSRQGNTTGYVPTLATSSSSPKVFPKSKDTTERRLKLNYGTHTKNVKSCHGGAAAGFRASSADSTRSSSETVDPLPFLKQRLLALSSKFVFMIFHPSIGLGGSSEQSGRRQASNHSKRHATDQTLLPLSSAPPSFHVVKDTMLSCDTWPRQASNPWPQPHSSSMTLPGSCSMMMGPPLHSTTLSTDADVNETTRAQHTSLMSCSNLDVSVLSQPMMQGPGFQRGDVLFLTYPKTIHAGDVIVFQVHGRDIPIVHRGMNIHEDLQRNISLLTKGDNNSVDDRALYAANQMFLENEHILGIAQAYVPYVGMMTIWLNDYPWFKYLTLGLMGLFVILGKD